MDFALIPSLADYSSDDTRILADLVSAKELGRTGMLDAGRRVPHSVRHFSLRTVNPTV